MHPAIIENNLILERKADLDFIHDFKGFHKCDSKVKVEIWLLEKHAVVLFTELDDNPGTSVTNFAEFLVLQIFQKYLHPKYDFKNCLFAETYDKVKDGIDMILVEFDINGQPSDADWKHLGKIVK